MKRIVLCGLALAALAGVPARGAEDGGVGAVVDAAETVLVNGRPRPELMITTDDQGGWSFRYERDLRAEPAAWLDKDAPRTDMRWQGWEALADKWRNGLFGGHLTYALEFPRPVHAVSASALVSNFADGQMMIGDTYFEQQDWIAAEQAYQQTQRIGLYGDMRHVLPPKLERGAPLAENQREEKARADAARETRDWTLVVPDEPLHVPAADGLFRADLTQAGAAERLRMLIERAASVRPGLVPAAETPTTGRRIFVGYGPHLQSVVSPPEAPDGLKIAKVGPRRRRRIRKTSRVPVSTPCRRRTRITRAAPRTQPSSQTRWPPRMHPFEPRVGPLRRPDAPRRFWDAVHHLTTTNGQQKRREG